MPGPQMYRAVDRFNLETAELSPQARAETVRQAVERAEADGLTAAGVYSSGAYSTALVNLQHTPPPSSPPGLLDVV